ncbi:MAG: hypothetical protein RLZZ401_2240 [Pseudomonadota bacterium]
MGISLGLLYQASGSSTRHVGQVERHQQAILLADSLLESRDAVSEAGWNESGNGAGLSWQVHSTRYTTPVSASNPLAVPLHEVFLTITWDESGRVRRLETSTLRPERKTLKGPVR